MLPASCHRLHEITFNLDLLPGDNSLPRDHPSWNILWRELLQFAARALPHSHPSLQNIIYNVAAERPVRMQLEALRDEMRDLDTALMRLANQSRLATVAFAPLVGDREGIEEVHRRPFEEDDVACISELLPQVAQRGMLRFYEGKTDE